MPGLFSNLPQLSYRTSFLWKVAMSVVALGVSVGFAFYLLTPKDPEAFVETFAPELDSPMPEVIPEENLPPEEKPKKPPKNAVDDKGDDFSRQLTIWATDAHRQMVNESFLRAIAESKFSPEEKEIARLMVDSIQKGGQPNANLVALTEENPPAKYSFFALGSVWLERGYLVHAARCFEREDNAWDNELARSNAALLYTLEGSYQDLIRLQDNPRYQELLEPQRDQIAYERAVAERNWPEIIKQTLIYQYTGFGWQFMLIGLLTGIAWFAFLMHTARLWARRGDMALCGVAIVLGALSTTLTLLIITLQEEVLGFEEKYDLIGGLLYCVAGVGLREEFCKLLLFTPLLPWLVRKKDPLLAMIVAGCVGLGFAAEENVSYLHMSAGIGGPGRFLTANFLHISTTALTGYALYRVCVNGWRELDYFASMFGMIVFAHGLYNAFIMLPALMEYSLFSGTIYVLLCYQMYQILDSLRPRSHQKISLSFVFTLALSVVLAVCLGWVISLAGFNGIRILGAEIVSVGVMIIMFFRLINEPLQN